MSPWLVSAFNTESLLEVDVEHTDDGINIHFDEDTLGINRNSANDGFSVTPDWNDRHFTLAFSEDSVLYHLTYEGARRDDRPGEGNLPPEAFIGDVYAAVRGMAPAYPISRLSEDIDEIGKPEFEEIRDYLEEKSVLEIENSRYIANKKRMGELAETLEEDLGFRKDLFDRILTPFSLEEAVNSGTNIFVLPNVHEKEIFLVFLLPDDYAEIIELRHFFIILDSLSRPQAYESMPETGSQVLNFLSQALINE